MMLMTMITMLTSSGGGDDMTPWVERRIKRLTREEEKEEEEEGKGKEEEVRCAQAFQLG